MDNITFTENEKRGNMYTVITWPDIQELMVEEGFRDHSYLINDNKGIEDFGSSAYFVDINWLNAIKFSYYE